MLLTKVVEENQNSQFMFKNSPPLENPKIVLFMRWCGKVL
jgi:hypothetical protein